MRRREKSLEKALEMLESDGFELADARRLYVARSLLEIPLVRERLTGRQDLSHLEAHLEVAPELRTTLRRYEHEMEREILELGVGRVRGKARAVEVEDEMRQDAYRYFAGNLELGFNEVELRRVASERPLTLSFGMGELAVRDAIGSRNKKVLYLEQQAIEQTISPMTRVA